ncbi:MAG: hypothetical protein PHV99_00460 [Candidatus Pacebacteria bacterium]|nr:hypothetical protein [Candidatus Paceibacterota bacterium]
MIAKRHTAVAGAAALMTVGVLSFSQLAVTEYRSEAYGAPERFIPLPELNKDDYNTRMLALAHITIATSSPQIAGADSALASSTSRVLPISTASTSVQMPGSLWPVSTVYPNAMALLPFKRIVAYYGNFYSKNMGVLGEYPEDTLLAMLASTTARWAAADHSTPVVPAIQYIATVAQASAGKEGKYILRMPDSQIDHALELADKAHGIVFLDVQVALSTLQYELPHLEKYLKMPQVHLAIDPEFSMKSGNRPGTVIGTFDASDINYAAEYLAALVRDNHLPPKMLVVHRFTQNMVTNYKRIRPLPEVQIVMDMDGWGSQAKKKGTYNNIVADEPVQFTGIKLFYKNDLKPPSTGLLTIREVLDLTPAPIYIQYQ